MWSLLTSFTPPTLTESSMSCSLLAGTFSTCSLSCDWHMLNALYHVTVTWQDSIEENAPRGGVERHDRNTHSLPTPTHDKSTTRPIHIPIPTKSPIPKFHSRPRPYQPLPQFSSEGSCCQNTQGSVSTFTLCTLRASWNWENCNTGWDYTTGT